jgi:NADH-quinone oxidoreductase subunit D
LPVGFEERCAEFIDYLKPKLDELKNILIDNKIFIERTANVGILPLKVAINHGVTGAMLRASGLRYDLRRVDGYSVYPDLDFDIPIGRGEVGTLGDCWDRTFVRAAECSESVKIIEQCLAKLTTDLKRSRDFDPQVALPKKVRFKEQIDYYSRAENPRGELGFFFRTIPNSDIPFRIKARACSFSNLSVLPEISKGVMLADLIAIVGSLDLVMGEVDR